MHVKSLLVCFTLSFISRAQCFKNGYSEETCNNLLPNQDQGEPNITASNAASPFEIKLSSASYRSNRELEITILGDNIEGFQLQIRKAAAGRGSKPTRIGEFTEWPAEAAQPLSCDDGKNTAVTHRNLDSKKDLTFKWRAPDDDEGELKVSDAYVSMDGTYWADVSDIDMDHAELPVSLKDCGESKSCIRYSSDKEECDGNTCSYVLTYKNRDSPEVEFTLSALSEEPNSYSAVGFSETMDGKIDITACVRQNDEVSVKHYTVQAKGEVPTETTLNFEDPRIDKEGNNFWCEYVRPIEDVASEAVNFNKELFWIYTWGKMNDTANVPIMQDNWHQSSKAYNTKQNINEITYSSSASSITLSMFMLLSLSSLYFC